MPLLLVTARNARWRELTTKSSQLSPTKLPPSWTCCSVEMKPVSCPLCTWLEAHHSTSLGWVGLLLCSVATNTVVAEGDTTMRCTRVPPGVRWSRIRGLLLLFLS